MRVGPVPGLVHANERHRRASRTRRNSQPTPSHGMTNAPSATGANGPLGAAILEACLKCRKPETSTSSTLIDPRKPAYQRWQTYQRFWSPWVSFSNLTPSSISHPMPDELQFCRRLADSVAPRRRVSACLLTHRTFPAPLGCSEHFPGQGLLVGIGLVRQDKPLLHPPIGVDKHC